MKRWITIAALSVFTIWVGSGCGSVRNVKEIDLSITGLEMEFYPEHPSQEEKSFFDFGVVTNLNHMAVPARWDGPKLMPLNRNK